MPALKKKVAQKKTAKKVIRKKTAAKKSAVKKAPVKKLSVNKTAANKPIAKKLAVKKVTVLKTKPNGFPEKLRDIVIEALRDKKGDQIVTIDLQGRSAMADYMIVGTGRSNRQVTALAAHVRDMAYKAGAKNVRLEGMQVGDWVLVDVGDVLVHLFRPEVREFYQIEKIYEKR
jgi:ribosome-associated protein